MLPAADYYKVKVTPLEGSSVPDELKEPVNVGKDGTFSFRLPAGTYTFSAEGLNADGKRVLYGEYKNTVTVPDDISNQISITVTTVSSGGGAGEVRLPLAFDADCNIKCVTATWEAGGTAKTRSFTASNDGVTATADGVLTALTFTLQADGETAPPSVGYYTVTFSFYSDTAAKQELYWCTESISVSENLITDTWLNDSTQPYFDETDGKTVFHLTHSDIAKSTLYYVRSTGTTKNEGTYFEPFDSIEKALQKIARTYDSGSKYKISLLSDITESADTGSYIDPDCAFISIENPDSASDASPFSLTISSYSGTVYTINANRDSAHTGRVLYIGANADVTLNNVNITGGNIDDNGGGIFIYNGKLTLSGVAITDCSAASTDASSIKGNGGGIYNYNGTLTVTGGSITSCTAATSGGAVFNNVIDASVVSTITNCTITTCTASGTASGQGGGGIYNASGTLELSGVTITGKGNADEPEAANGGAVYNAGTLTVNGGEIADCVATTNGGGIYNTGTLTADGGTVSGCKASGTAVSQGGGGIYSSGTFTLSDVTITGCTAEAYGGGILTAGASTENTVTDCTITSCTAQGAVNTYGGGVYLDVGKLTVTGTEISSCKTRQGGGVCVGSKASAGIKNCEITSCRASNGGGIDNHGTLTVTGGAVSDCNGMGAICNWKTCTITDETTIIGCSNACGVYNNGGTLSVDGCTISDCTYSESGGIYISSSTTSATIKNCTITNCRAESTSSNRGFGGGINNECKSTTIENCTITNCSASKSGGGIYNDVTDATTAVTIKNCEITTCTAEGTATGQGGGGIYNDAGILELSGVTITGKGNADEPDAQYGGGIYNAGTFTMNGGEISGCTANSGGGIYNANSATLTADGTKISGCEGASGGGIRSGDKTTVNLTNCTIKSCTANTTNGGEAGGGGIYSYHSMLTISGGEISECNTGAQGGGIHANLYTYGTFSITDTTFSGCTARDGGGLYVMNAATPAEITNCTIELCTATGTSNSYGGGGIYVYDGLTTVDTFVNIKNCSVKLCSAPYGSGIYHTSGAVSLKDVDVSGDVYTRSTGQSLSLSGSTAITNGVIDLSYFASTTKPSVQIAGALTQSKVATIRLGTAYTAGDKILSAADGSGYALTAADCARFEIEGGGFGIGLNSGNGVLQ